MVRSETTGQYGVNRIDREYITESELLIVYRVQLSFYLSRACKMKKVLCLENFQNE